MALIPCPECRRRISETAESCPNCGYTLTLEEGTKIKKIRKKRSAGMIGFLVLLASFVAITILAVLYSPESTTTRSWEESSKSSTGTSMYSSQHEASKSRETQPPLAPAMSAPTTSELSETESQKEQATGSEAWLGTWSLEFIGGQSTEENLAESLQSDIFLSWNHTFYVDGRFESKLRQDTGNGIITTTTYGTYQVSGDKYNTVLKEAIMSMGSTSVPIPNITSYQSGTWSRMENTLTMIPVGSSTKVFELFEMSETMAPAKVSTEYDQKQKPRPLKQVVPNYPEDVLENLQITPPTEVSTEYHENPRLLRKVDPRYPEDARRAERGGLVTLEFTVEVDGKAADIKVIKPIGFGFDEAAVEAVKKWRFTPAKREGENVPARVRIPIRFTLE